MHDSPLSAEALILMTIERPPAALEALLIGRGFRVARRILSSEGGPVDTFFIHGSVQAP